LQLDLELGKGPAAPMALWEVLPENERRAAALLLAKLIAQTVAPETGDPERSSGE